MQVRFDEDYLATESPEPHFERRRLPAETHQPKPAPQLQQNWLEPFVEFQVQFRSYQTV